MIFYCDLQGNLKAFQNETVYQGSNNVTTIYVVAPFNRPVGLNISFTKPNKLVTSPAIMKWVGTLGNVKIPVSFVNIPEQFTDTYNVWAYALPYSITEQSGVVGVSVNAVIADSVDESGQQAYRGNLTTFTGQFTVAYSALPSPPTDIPTEWTQDKVLDLLNNYYNDAIQKIGELNTLNTDAKDTLVNAINEVLKDIPIINQDLSADGFTPVENTYYRHTGTTSGTYTAGVIYFYNGTAYKAIDGAGGGVSGTKLTGSLPTSGWIITSDPFWTGSKYSNDYKVKIGNFPNSYNLIDEVDELLFKISSDESTYTAFDLYSSGSDDIGTYREFSFTNESYHVYIYQNDDIYWRSVQTILLGLKSPVFGNYEYTISNSAIKTNSFAQMFLTDDSIKPYSKTDGSLTVIRDTVPTTPIDYALQIIETSSEGAFEIINDYKPTFPATLPAVATKIKSAFISFSWTASMREYWVGDIQPIANTYVHITTNTEYAAKVYATDVDVKVYGRRYDIETNSYTAWPYESTITVNDKVCKKYGKSDEGYIAIAEDGEIFGKIGYEFLALGFPDDDVYKYTISNSAIKTNSFVQIFLTDDGGIRPYSKTDGSLTVVRDTVPSVGISFIMQIVETDSEGAFEIVNSYLPTKISELDNDSNFLNEGFYYIDCSVTAINLNDYLSDDFVGVYVLDKATSSNVSNLPSDYTGTNTVIMTRRKFADDGVSQTIEWSYGTTEIIDYKYARTPQSTAWQRMRATADVLSITIPYANFVTIAGFEPFTKYCLVTVDTKYNAGAEYELIANTLITIFATYGIALYNVEQNPSDATKTDFSFLAITAPITDMQVTVKVNYSDSLDYDA